MATLRSNFEHFYPPDEKTIASAMRTGLVATDTNVLLNLYRFQTAAREQLFNALEAIGDRLWISHQVALEFHRRRLDVIAEKEEVFEKTKEDLDSSIEDYTTKLYAFTRRINLSGEWAQKIENTIKRAHQATAAQIAKVERENDVHLKNHDSDAVLSRLEKLLEGRVGEPMSPAEMDAARKEGQRRVNEGRPPGYKDKNKLDPTGDYLIWTQLMTEAKKRGLPTILVTDDRKDDWYRREHGLTLGARYELREEMTAEAGVPFILMTTGTFLLHAKNYLEVAVSSETVIQAKELPRTLEHEELSHREQIIRRDLDHAIAASRNLDEAIAEVQGRMHKTEIMHAKRSHLDRNPTQDELMEREWLENFLSEHQREYADLSAQRDAITRRIQAAQSELMHVQYAKENILRLLSSAETPDASN